MPKHEIFFAGGDRRVRSSTEGGPTRASDISWSHEKKDVPTIPPTTDTCPTIRFPDHKSLAERYTRPLSNLSEPDAYHPNLGEVLD